MLRETGKRAVYNEKKGGHYERPYRSPRRAGAQSEKYQRRYPSREDHRHCRGVRFGKIVARSWRALRGRLPAVSGIPLHVYAAAHDHRGESRCRRGALCPGGARPTAAARRGGHPQHLRHGDRAPEQPPPHVFPPRQPPLPPRALSAAVAGRRGGTAPYLSRVRRRILRALRGRARLQQSGRVPRLRGHRRGAHRGPGFPHSRREPHH